MRKPFGQADCESEVKELQDSYSKLYFDETPFNSAAIKPETYLIVGRRGAGKTALSRYFSFQRELRDPLYIDVDEPKEYRKVLSDIASRAAEEREEREVAIPRLQKVWEYVIWCVIFEHTRDRSKVIADACDQVCSVSGVSYLINSIIDRLLSALRDSQDEAMDRRITQLVTDKGVDAARREVLKLASQRPVVAAFDTLEKYDVNSGPLMNAMAALVQCAADFNVNYSRRGIHLKVFMSGEVFPYLEEDVLQNTSKSVKDPVYLFWRPKDLLRLISWRFYHFLKENKQLLEQSKGDIDWTNHHEVLDKMWTPYFGRDVASARGLKEHSFPYVLRHTQMRPRQLILLCNEMAKRSIEGGRFPSFSNEDIVEGVKAGERELAKEIINSFSEVYPNVSMIVDALMKMPMLFKGNELDKRASQTAAEWPPGSYSQARFRRLAAELGIVGRVRRHNEESGYIDADFEYSLRERLPITHRDECVIHPMFYSRFNVEFNSPARVMPFSTERDGEDVV